MKDLNLYIHIPFCQRRCNYCGFYTLANQQKQISQYFQALERDLLSYQNELKYYQIKTIYFGGGTPSLPDTGFIRKLLQIIFDNFKIVHNLEITLEANPESLNINKLKDYKSAGINRLSLGLQAWQDVNLKFLGRAHSQAKFLEIYQIAKKLDFKNINVDLIFGFPDHKFVDWQQSLNEVTNLQPQHISCYSLELDKHSTFGDLYHKGKLKPLSESLDRKMYHWTVEYLEKENYLQYEISNFSKDNFQCKHNLDFWHYKEYLGLGASAYSFWKNRRFANVFSIKKYIDNFSKKVDVIADAFSFQEALSLQLRLNEGVDVEQFEKSFNVQLFDILSSTMKFLEERKLIKIEKNNIYLTKLGKDLENQVVKEILKC